MATRIITCPSCDSRYQTKAAAAGRQLQCPKCGTKLVIPAEPIIPSDPLDSLAPSDVSTASPAGLGAGLPQQGLRASNLAQPASPRRKPGFSLDPRLMPFLKRLGLGVGIICLLILLMGAIGWISKSMAVGAVMALGAMILGIGAMLGLALAGNIWALVIAFRESVWLGIGVIFVPFLGIHLILKPIGRSQLAFAMVFSSLLPALATMGVILLLEPRHSPPGRSAVQAKRLANKADQLAESILEFESENTPAGEPSDVTFVWITKIDDPSKVVTEGDRGLSQFAGYVKGSLTVDRVRRTVSLQHRGTTELESRYRLYLCSITGILIRPQLRSEKSPTGADSP